MLALLVLATPALAIYAVWRQRQLRRQVEELTHLSSQQNDALHRELLQLRRQVAAFPQHFDSTAVHREDTAQPTPSIVASKPPQPAPPAPAGPSDLPVPGPAPAAMKPDLAPNGTRPAFCAWCSTVHAGGVDNCPKPIAVPVDTSVVDSTPVSVKQEQEEEVAARAVIVTKPATPAASHTVDDVCGEPKPEPAEVVTSLPLPAVSVPSEISPQSPATTNPPIHPRAVTPPASPHIETPHTLPPPVVAPPSSSARVAPPPQFAALRSSAPKPTAEQRMKSVRRVLAKTEVD